METGSCDRSFNYIVLIYEAIVIAVSLVMPSKVELAILGVLYFIIFYQKNVLPRSLAHVPMYIKHYGFIITISLTLLSSKHRIKIIAGSFARGGEELSWILLHDEIHARIPSSLKYLSNGKIMITV